MNFLVCTNVQCTYVIYNVHFSDCGPLIFSNKDTFVQMRENCENDKNKILNLSAFEVAFI